MPLMQIYGILADRAHIPPVSYIIGMKLSAKGLSIEYPQETTAHIRLRRRRFGNRYISPNRPTAESCRGTDIHNEKPCIQLMTHSLDKLKELEQTKKGAIRNMTTFLTLMVILGDYPQHETTEQHRKRQQTLRRRDRRTQRRRINCSEKHVHEEKWHRLANEAQCIEVTIRTRKVANVERWLKVDSNQGSNTAVKSTGQEGGWKLEVSSAEKKGSSYQLYTQITKNTKYISPSQQLITEAIKYIYQTEKNRKYMKIVKLVAYERMKRAMITKAQQEVDELKAEITKNRTHTQRTIIEWINQKTRVITQIDTQGRPCTYGEQWQHKLCNRIININKQHSIHKLTKKRKQTISRYWIKVMQTKCKPTYETSSSAPRTKAGQHSGGFGGPQAHVHCEVNLNIEGSHRAKMLQIRLAAAQVSHYMDPAGDGLCYWYCLAEAVFGITTNQQQKIIRALQLQKQVLAWTRAAYNKGDHSYQRHMNALANTHNQQEFNAKVTELERKPQEWTSQMGEIVITNAAQALSLNITTYTTSEIEINQARKLVINKYRARGAQERENEDIRVFRDHVGSHYILIHKMTDGWHIRQQAMPKNYPQAQDDKAYRESQDDMFTPAERARINTEVQMECNLQPQLQRIDHINTYYIAQENHEPNYEIVQRYHRLTHTEQNDIDMEDTTTIEADKEDEHMSTTQTDADGSRNEEDSNMTITPIDSHNYIISATNKKLYVKETKHKGDGLFTKSFIPYGGIIDKYLGKLSTTPTSGRYVVQAGTKAKPIWIDGDPQISPQYINGIPIGSHGQARAAKANEPGLDEWVNAKLVKTAQGAHLVAIAPGGIRPDSEILICYGNEYKRDYPHNHRRSKCLTKQTMKMLQHHLQQKNPRTNNNPKIKTALTIEQPNETINALTNKGIPPATGPRQKRHREDGPEDAWQEVKKRKRQRKYPYQTHNPNEPETPVELTNQFQALNNNEQEITKGQGQNKRDESGSTKYKLEMTPHPKEATTKVDQPAQDTSRLPIKRCIPHEAEQDKIIVKKRCPAIRRRKTTKRQKAPSGPTIEQFMKQSHDTKGTDVHVQPGKRSQEIQYTKQTKKRKRTNKADPSRKKSKTTIQTKLTASQPVNSHIADNKQQTSNKPTEQPPRTPVTETKDKIQGRKIDNITDLYTTNRPTGNPTDEMIIAMVNLRSQGGDGNDNRKTTGIDTLHAFPESSIPTVFGVVETWEKSVSARERIRESIQLGWKRIFLDAVKPHEDRRGGQVINLKGNEWWYKASMLHEDSIMMIRLRKKNRVVDQTGRTIKEQYAKRELCILQAYVGTGNHPAKGEVAIRMTKIWENAIKEAAKNNKDIIAMGDWNNLNKRWRRIGHDHGLKTVAHSAPDTIMARVEGASLEGGYMNKKKEWITDHMCLWLRIVKKSEQVNERMQEQRPSSRIVAANKEEYQALLLEELEKRKWNQRTSTEKNSARYRYDLENAIQAAGIRLTQEHKKETVTDMEHLPLRLQKIRRDADAAKNTGDAGIIKDARRKFFREYKKWRNERWYEAMVRKDNEYDEGEKVKWMHRKYIKEAKMADLITFRDKDGSEYYQPQEVREQVKLRIGQRYVEAPARSSKDTIKKNFQPYVAHKGGLHDIGGIPSHHEIEEVIKHMGANKGMGPDDIAKEMINAAPDGVRKDVYNRIQQLFTEGMTKHDCQTDVIMLIKNILLYENDETNLRPISLIKFIAKTAQAIVAWRWKNKNLGLTNYGFTKETGCTQAILKIHSIMEHALLHNKEIHLMTIDVEKAYDTVRFDVLEEAMTRYGVPEDVKRLLMDAHTKREIQIKTGWGKTEKIIAQCGLAQGSPVSCLLFIMVMQPLLDRLRAETQGIWRSTDDVAYADDVTLLAPSAKEMARKWKIVKEFSKYTGLQISLRKTEYMTNVQDPDKRMKFKEKEKKITQVSADEAIRILGYWNNVALQKDRQYQKLMDGIRLVQKAMYRHQIPPKMVIGVMNMIINAKVRYVTVNSALDVTTRNELQQICTKLVKDKLRLKKETSTAWIFSPPSKGGLGIMNPAEIADAALISEYAYHINSKRHSELADLLDDNYRCVANAIGPEFLAFGKDAPVENIRKHEFTLSAQVRKAMNRVGWKLQTQGSHEAIDTWSQHAPRKKIGMPIHKGQYVIIKENTNNWAYEFLLHVREIIIENDKITGLYGEWAPKYFQPADDFFGSRNIFGMGERQYKDNFHIQGSEVLKCLTLDEELEEIGHKPILRELQRQFPCDIGDAPKVQDFPGIKEWGQAITEGTKIYSANVTRISGNIRTRIGRKETTELLHITRGEEINLNRQIDEHIRERRHIAEYINTGPDAKWKQIYTDGSVKETEQGIRSGCGIVAMTSTGACPAIGYALEGVNCSTGAEMYPIYKVLNMWDGSQKIDIHTDSEAVIYILKRLQQDNASDREIWNHRERAMIRKLQNIAQTKLQGMPIHETRIKEDTDKGVSGQHYLTIGNNLILRKVISHSGDTGNTYADIVATYARDGKLTRSRIIQDTNRYDIYDSNNQKVYGNIYRQIRHAYQEDWLDRWKRQEKQGEWARDQDNPKPWMPQTIPKIWDAIRKTHLHIKWTTEIITNTFEWEKLGLTDEDDEEGLWDLTEEERREIEEMRAKERAKEDKRKATRGLTQRTCHLCGEKRIRSTHMLQCKRAATTEGMAAIKAHMNKSPASQIRFPTWVKLSQHTRDDGEGVWITQIESETRVNNHKYAATGYIRKTKLSDLIHRWTGPREDKAFWEEVQRLYKDTQNRKIAGTTPKWIIPPALIESLMDAGIDQEVVGSPIESSTHVETIWSTSEQDYPMFGMKRRTSVVPPGGTIGRATYSQQTKHNMQRIQRELAQYNDQGIRARYVLVMAVPKVDELECQQAILNSQGHIIMRWKENTVEMVPGDWFYGPWTTKQYQAHPRTYHTRPEQIWIVKWENTEAKKAWKLARSGWESLVHFAIEHTQHTPPILGEDNAIPWRAENQLRLGIRDRMNSGPGVMQDTIVEHQEWTWLKQGMQMSGMEGFWMATRLTKFDPRDDTEKMMYNEMIKMGQPQAAQYTVTLNGTTVNITDKYWEDKLQQKRAIAKLRKADQARIDNHDQASIALILGVARRVFMGMRQMERRSRWEDNRQHTDQPTGTTTPAPSIQKKKRIDKAARTHSYKTLQMDASGKITGEITNNSHHNKQLNKSQRPKRKNSSTQTGTP